MSKWYEKLHGDTGVFAIRISFAHDPFTGTIDDLSTSWGTFELWAQGRCLTRSASPDGHADAVTWSLLPLLEWLAEHAPDLLNGEPFPAPVASDEVRDGAGWLHASGEPLVTLTDSEEDDWFEQRSEWREQHALRAGLVDATLPMVLMRRVGSFVEVSWDNEGWGCARPNLSFTERRGAVLLPPRSTAVILTSALDEAARALHGKANTTRTQALLDRVAAFGAKRADWRRLLHPATARVVTRDPELVERIERQQGCGILATHTLETLALRAVRLSDLSSLAPLVEEVSAPPADWGEELLGLRQPQAPEPLAPWSAGYDAALEFRRRAGWGNEPVAELLVEWLHRNAVQTRKRVLPSSGQLLTVSDEARQPRITTRGTASPTQLATGLGHLLLDEDVVSVDGTPWEHWPTAARARAFAAMLLMPADGVRAKLRAAGGVTPEGVRAVTETYGTSPVSATWHLKNLGLIGDELRSEILQELGVQRG